MFYIFKKIEGLVVQCELLYNCSRLASVEMSVRQRCFTVFMLTRSKPGVHSWMLFKARLLIDRGYEEGLLAGHPYLLRAKH